MNISTSPSSSALLAITERISLAPISIVSPSAPMLSSLVTAAPSACSLDDASLRLPLAFLYSILFLLGLAGNLFALWVFLFVHASRNSVRVFLINCAVADLVLLTCLPFRIFYHINGNHWLLGHVACKLVGNLFYMNMYISVTLLGFISLDRYLRLRWKGRARCVGVRLCGCTWPWSWLACGTLWATSLAALVPMIATAEDDEEEDRCFQFKHRRLAYGKAYFNVVLVALFWLVFLTLVASYAQIARRLIQVSRNKPDLPNAQRYGRGAKKSFFVLFLFTLCFAPYHAFRPVYIVAQLNPATPCDYLGMVDYVNEVVLLFSAFNSCLDPVMYFLLSGSVRRTTLQALEKRLPNRLFFQNEVASNSSTAEFRRSSVPVAWTRTVD
ncbi:putative G-protein coupled receptor 34 [Stigmatopora argus]